jgi:hypothetical protein
MGKTEIYIITIYENWTAGWRAARLTQENPAVLVETASKRPFRTFRPGGKSTTGPLPS